MSFEPVIKWSGSKRSQSQHILKQFPRKIKTYYEPFVGGGSVMYALITSDEIEVENIVCSDINKDLIDLWNMIKNQPELLILGYEERWLELNKDEDHARRNEYYKYIRNRFNQERNPIDFLFIDRTTTNGLIRYNKKGDFNNSFHFNRKGIEPNRLKKIINNWSENLNKKNVTFLVQDYKNIKTESMDFLYCDPPYENTKGMYFGGINQEELFNWLREQKSAYLLSYDGICGENDRTSKVPQDLYDSHIYISSGCSSFKRIKLKNIEYVQESLYIKLKRDIN